MIWSLTSPIPDANIDEPPTPLTVRELIGFKDMKSVLMGEIWTVAPVSRKNG